MKRILFSLTILLLVSGCTDDLLFSTPSLQGKLNNNFVWRASAFSATVVSDTINIKGYNGNNSLQIMIPATSIGNYGLSSSSFASVSFMQDGLTYSTLNNGSSGLGQLSDGLIELIEYNGNNKIFILQCSSIYPTLDNELNLNVIDTYKKMFNYKVGFSDHSKSIISTLVAVSKGAKIIEKHFTIDNSLEGPDHFYALNPIQFKKMSLTIKRVNKMLGSYNKKPLKNELKFCRRDSLFLNKNLKKNSKVKPQDFSIKQPQIGIPSKYLNKLGKMKLNRNLKSGSVLKWKDIF